MVQLLSTSLRRRYLGLLVLPAVLLWAPAGAWAGNNVAPNNTACGYHPDNTTFMCFTGPGAIQQAVDFAGSGGTVNVGPGKYPEHVQIQHGLTLRGSGHDTVITGTLDSPLVAVGQGPTGLPPGEPPVTIQYLTLQGTSGGAGGYMLYIKDRNPANEDTVSNVWFTEVNPSGTTPRRDLGLYNENSTADLAVTNNTFKAMSVGVEIDSNGGSGPNGADYVNDNRFDDLVGIGNVPKGVVFSINTPNGGGTQDIDGNEFHFKGGHAISVAGSNYGGSITGHDNAFDGPAFGVNNSSPNQVDATDSWWGCPEGPLGTKDECSDVAGDVLFRPWLTSRPPDHWGAHD